MSFFAQETWFTDMTASDWSFAFEAATLAMLALALVYGSDPDLRPAVSAVWPWARPRLKASGLPAASRT